MSDDYSILQKTASIAYAMVDNKRKETGSDEKSIFASILMHLAGRSFALAICQSKAQSF